MYLDYVLQLCGFYWVDQGGSLEEKLFCIEKFLQNWDVIVQFVCLPFLWWQNSWVNEMLSIPNIDKMHQTPAIMMDIGPGWFYHIMWFLPILVWFF